MKIRPDYTVEDIQQQFEDAFPHLQLRFYHHAHQEGEGSPVRDEVHLNVSMRELNEEVSAGEIRLSEMMTVADLETRMESEFGLHVQIFRKSGDTWLQTSATDHWNLGMQEESALNAERR